MGVKASDTIILMADILDKTAWYALSWEANSLISIYLRVMAQWIQHFVLHLMARVCTALALTLAFICWT